MRVIFLAEPTDDTPPKTEPDDESLCATWVTLDELAKYKLRADEVPELFALHVLPTAAIVYPPELLPGLKAHRLRTTSGVSRLPLFLSTRGIL